MRQGPGGPQVDCWEEKEQNHCQVVPDPEEPILTGAKVVARLAVACHRGGRETFEGGGSSMGLILQRPRMFPGAQAMALVHPPHPASATGAFPLGHFLWATWQGGGPHSPPMMRNLLLCTGTALPVQRFVR